VGAQEEAQELQEHAEHARHDPSLAPVSLTMAILAVLVAAAALLGHRAHTEEIILQTRAGRPMGVLSGAQHPPSQPGING
jgi:hypothetical protein